MPRFVAAGVEPVPPKSQRTLSVRHDDYAAHRCHCNHIVYQDDEPGGECRFCSCVNHFSDARPSPDSLHDCDDRFDTHGVSGYEL